MAKVRTKGSRKPPAEYLFGTPEDINNREFEAGLFNAGGNVQDHAPAFKQIPPSSGSGSVNRAGYKHKSGEMKFSGGPGKI
jgi:hypothetical protein